MQVNKSSRAAISGWFSKIGWLIDRIFDLIVVLGLIALIFLVLFFVLMLRGYPEVSNAAALADLDGDGDLDALLANGKSEGRTANSVWINQGGAQGGSPGDFSLLEQAQPWGLADSKSLALGDLDGDGDPDAVVGNDGFVGIFLNKGGMQAGEPGTFRETSRGVWNDFIIGEWDVALGDLDTDEDLDIWVANCCSGWDSGGEGDFIWVPAHNLVGFNETLPGGGSLAHFKDSEQRLGIEGSGDVALGDLDGDGDLDAFVANSSSATGVEGEQLQMEHDQPDRVWLNDGTGYFTDSGQELGATESYRAELGDLDSDGDLDALVLGFQRGYVWSNNRYGIFSLTGELKLFDGRPKSLHLGDLDGDGDLDAVMGWEKKIQTWLNDGRGGFQEAYETYNHPKLFATALGDLDGDGDLDLFAGKLAEETIVWLNDGQAEFARR